jgi:hypothetical protein
MKSTVIISGLCALFGAASMLAEELAEDTLEKHREGSDVIAAEQDELSADVQQLVIEQTVPKVIALLNEVEELMDEATDRLDEADTGGLTIAAQTEIIEKIHAAAKEKQSKGSGGDSGSAMMDMMERMMGKKPGGDKPGKGEKPGSKGGEGQTGESDAANEGVSGKSGGGGEARRVPKASGGANTQIPEEFRKAFDAYNRGAGELIK